jgi:iron(III) transport system ATP-binding protein
MSTDERQRTKHLFLTPEERNLGIVFQTYVLRPRMSVAMNLRLPLKLRKVPKSRQREQISEVLHQVGLKEHKDRYPHQLSGGQQQRVSLARARLLSRSAAG